MPRDNARLQRYHMQHLLPGLTALTTVNLINYILGRACYLSWDQKQPANEHFALRMHLQY